MKLTPIDKQEKDLGNYTWQKVTFSAPQGKLLKYTQIKKVCSEFQKNLPKGATMIVDGMNILRRTNLFSSYMKENSWLSELGVSEADQDKLNAFFEFTVTVRIPKENFT